MAQTVTLHVEPYGDFTAKMRDVMTDMRISCRADEQIAKQDFDPKMMSAETRNLFLVMATFYETCEEGGTPPGFDAGAILRSETAKGLGFFFDYNQALGEAEARFREGVQGLVPAKSVGASPDKAVEGA